MKTNQKGFSIVEILIAIVAVGLFGAVGMLVYEAQKNKTNIEGPSVQSNNWNKATSKANEQFDGAESKNEEAANRKSFSAYGVKISLEEIEGWKYQGVYGYPGEESNEYQINVFNKTRDIQLSLQISTFETSLYEPDIIDSFIGFNGKTYYITKSIDDVPGDTKYQQMGISACSNGHCVTKLKGVYNLNANITPLGANREFDGSSENLETVKKLFTSIKAE